MNGDQLRTWRTNRQITQDKLAEYLGWTRQKVANVEAERTTMKDDITAQLVAIDQVTGHAKAPNNVKRIVGRRYLALDGSRLHPDMVANYSRCGQQFYQWICSDADGHLFNLMELGPSTAKPGRIVPQCTPIHLEATAWQVGAMKQQDHPGVIAAIPRLQKLLDDNPNKPDLARVLAGSDEVFSPATAEQPAGMFQETAK